MKSIRESYFIEAIPINCSMQTQNRTSIFRNTLLFATITFGSFLLAVYFQWFGPGTNVGGGFCEAAREGMIKQPANTWSNLSFIFFGLLIAYQLSSATFSHANNILTRSTFTATFFASLVVFLGQGSMAMHATETITGGVLDMLSMYLLAAFATAYAIQRSFNWNNLNFTITFFSVVGVCEIAGQYHGQVPIVGYAGNLAFGLFLITAASFESYNAFVKHFQITRKYGYWSIFFLLLGFTVWNMWLDGSPLCDPGSLIQGHAIWHICCAIAAYFLFRFYVSEEVGTEN